MFSIFRVVLALSLSIPTRAQTMNTGMGMDKHPHADERTTSLGIVGKTTDYEHEKD